MRIRDFRSDDEPEINLVPLIDVVLCLIIFFVVTTTFDARSVLKLELPRADGQPAQQQDQPLSVLVNAQGRYFVEDREALRTDVESLKQTITDVAGTDRNRAVLLRAAQLYAESHPDPDDPQRIRATYELVFLTGWAPDASQQKPLRPGSAKMPLAEALASTRKPQ